MKVFLSYAREDQADANSIQKNLQRSGISVFRDETNLNVSDHFFDAISSAIESVECFIVLLTPNSITKPWVVTECEHARNVGARIIGITSGIGSQELEIPHVFRREPDATYSEINGEVQSNLLQLSCPLDEKDLGRVVKELHRVIPSIRHEKYFRRPPTVSLLARPDCQSTGRIRLCPDDITEAYERFNFGRTGIVCPVNRMCNLNGNVTTTILKHFGASASDIEVPPTGILAGKPIWVRNVISPRSNATAELLVGTVFSNKRTSADQRAVADGLLQLAHDREISVIFVPLFGTGRDYRYPSFQAYKSFLAGVLAYYERNTNERNVPWICIANLRSDKIFRLFIGYHNQVDIGDLKNIAKGDVRIILNGTQAWFVRTTTIRGILQQFARKTGSEKLLDANKVRIAMGRGKYLAKNPELPNENYFEYGLDEKIEDTILSDLDHIAPIDESDLNLNADSNEM